MCYMYYCNIITTQCTITSEGLSPKAILMLVPSHAHGDRPCSARSCTTVLKYKCSIAGFQLLQGNL